jgi:hypothetical protein
MVDRTDLTEDDFRDFVKATVKKNPNCFYIVDEHPLKS